MTRMVTLQVNGKTCPVENPGSLTLMFYLRDHLGLAGAKNGCNQGHCGSCTVIVDGKARRSCLLKVANLDGSKVETIENLSKNGTLHPLHQAFLQEGAVQCGFCTPGMVMAAKALLDLNPEPDAGEIKKALRFNLCRCTGYGTIIKAVQRAAALLAGKAALQSGSGSGGERAAWGVGDSPPKKDGLPKVTGAPLYADDLNFPGQLFGKLLLSPHPFARIIKIETGRAEGLPGVIKILTARDIPGRNGFGLLNPHQPVLAGELVRYTGDAVAVVFADSTAAAAAALPCIDVTYEVLPGVFSAEQGMHDEAPAIHPGGNIMSHISVRKGDVARGFAAADIIEEGCYTTPMVEHAYLEPEAAVAKVDEEGMVTVWSASQGSYAFREMIAASLKLPQEKVRVIYTPAGGAFGGKEEPTVQIHCALGAIVTGRPVKITLTRQESMLISTKRHGATMYYRHGATKDGKIIAMEAKVIVDAGAYDSLSKPVVFRSGVVTAGPYEIPNVQTDAYGVYTNHPPGGAFRGFGSTQVAFAAELQLDKLARRLQLDPFEMRRINGLAPGKITITGQVLKGDCGYQETLAAVEQALQAYLRELPSPRAGKKRGTGLAGSYKNVGLGAGKNDRAGAKLELDREGRVVLKVGAVDMGQGSDTILAQLAAQATGLAYEDICVVSNDTSQTPDGGVTTASRQTYISGHAVLGAAAIFSDILANFLTAHYGLEAGDYAGVTGGLQVQSGAAGLQPGGSRFITYQELAAAAAAAGVELAGEYVYTAPPTYPLRERADHEEGVPEAAYEIHFAYCFAAQAAVVEVDEQTGEVEILKIIAAQDLGRAIHPQNSHSQIEGAVAMGMGYALSEEFTMSEGKMITDNLAKLKLTKITGMPPLETILVEVAAQGPHGAKGMGEVPVNPTAPAIINAIYDAVGVRIADLPATTEKILQAMQKKGGCQCSAPGRE